METPVIWKRPDLQFPTPFDTIFFDVDGVLIKTIDSFHATDIATAEYVVGVMTPTTYSAVAISVAWNESMVLISTPSTSKKMVSKGVGNCRSGRFQITGVSMKALSLCYSNGKYASVER